MAHVESKILGRTSEVTEASRKPKVSLLARSETRIPTNTTVAFDVLGLKPDERDYLQAVERRNFAQTKDESVAAETAMVRAAREVRRRLAPENLLAASATDRLSALQTAYGRIRGLVEDESLTSLPNFKPALQRFATGLVEREAASLQQFRQEAAGKEDVLVIDVPTPRPTLEIK